MLQNNKKNLKNFNYLKYKNHYQLVNDSPLFVLRHWLKIGQFNNYSSNIKPFDYEYYIKKYNLDMTKEEAQNNWFEYGLNNGRDGSNGEDLVEKNS